MKSLPGNERQRVVHQRQNDFDRPYSMSRSVMKESPLGGEPWVLNVAEPGSVRFQKCASPWGANIDIRSSTQSGWSSTIMQRERGPG